MSQSRNDKPRYLPCSVGTTSISVLPGFGISCATLGGHGVVLSSGQLNFGLDLIDPASHGGWGFSLNYLSGSGVDSILGRNFNYSQNARLQVLDNGDVELLTDQNTVSLFEHTGGSYLAAANNVTGAVLSRSGNGEQEEFSLIIGDVAITFFGVNGAMVTPGRLKSVSSLHGGTRTYSWRHAGERDQLTTASDAHFRTVDYRYHTAGPAAGLVREIVDFFGRKLNFQYDGAGRLVAVVLRVAPGRKFSGSTVFAFQYDSDNANPERQDDLIRVWHDGEALDDLDARTGTVSLDRLYANARPNYIMEYGQDPSDPDSYGRVVRQTAGERYEFSYTAAGPPDNELDSSDPVLFRCTMTVNKGRKNVFDFNGASMLVRAESSPRKEDGGMPDRTAATETWFRYNRLNQLVKQSRPERIETVEFSY